MAGSYSVSATEPPPLCGFCGSCKDLISINCFAKQHLAYCEAVIHGKSQCGRLYSIEEGCWRHPKWGNHNTHTKPCLSPRLTPATFLIDHAKVEAMQRGPPVLRGTVGEIVWTGPRKTAGKEQASPAPQQTPVAGEASPETTKQRDPPSPTMQNGKTSAVKNSGRGRTSSSSSTGHHDTPSMPSPHGFNQHPLHASPGAIEGH